MKQLCGIFDLQNGLYIDASKDIYSYVDEECELYICGKIRLNNDNMDGKKLWESYKKHGNSLTEHMAGVYILIVYDKIKKALQVFHDRTTSSLTLYYTTNAGKVYLGTSLKWLLKMSGIKRIFNDAVLEDFLVNGFIYGKDTLIKNVCKLSAFTSIMLYNGSITEVPVKYYTEALSKGDALNKWESVLSGAINRSLDGKKEINIPLSSGYDSNYIAYIVRSNTDKVINAYSVGGKFGKNELPQVEENISSYERITLNTALTDEKSLLNLPDIVWRLEGAVYEVGIFLQYELARLVSKSGKTSLICGECADQIMNQYYLSDERNRLPNHSDSPVYYEFSEYPYIFGSFLILKKNGLLSNSFGLETEYPYLDDEFVSVAHSLKEINQKDKRIHIAICRERLPAAVLKNISKIGGATDFHSLFANKEDLNRFFSAIESSEFYQKYISVIKKVSHFEREKQTGVNKIKTMIRNVVLDIFHIGSAERKQNAYYFEELRIKECMCCAYLILFDKLFISGDYDDKLDCEGVNVGLYDLI